MKVSGGAGETRLELQSDPHAVRRGLATLAKAPAFAALDEDLRSAAEIVLAEVLNNIVEHAYAGTTGVIELKLSPRAGTLCCDVRDFGVALPDGRVPGALLPAGDADGPPEGGFGWYLIHSLASDLRYRRRGGCNHLRFTLDPDRQRR